MEPVQRNIMEMVRISISPDDAAKIRAHKMAKR
jgi:hypothetical protein